MMEVYVAGDIDRALRILQKKMMFDGDLQRYKERTNKRFDPKPSERRRRKLRKAMLRRKKAARRRAWVANL